jgi:hypothetical protein
MAYDLTCGRCGIGTIYRASSAPTAIDVGNVKPQERNWVFGPPAANVSFLAVLKTHPKKAQA